MGTDLCCARFIWLTLPAFNLEKVKSILVIGYLSIFLLVNRGVSNAMEARITSFEWKRLSLEGRALLGTHAAPETEAQPPLIGPVAPKHLKTKHSLVAALTVLMVIGVAAISCCCYQWEGRLRGQGWPRSAAGHSELAGSGTRSSSSSLQDSVPSISVVMPGDNIPRFVAWAVPQRVPDASTMPEARVQPESIQHVEKTGLNTVVAPNS